mmetsp:Transcript_74730/g.173076  ORF Transcript_74730/g.173076 Transcript_74730/m.173076 type:complete len:197 (+) Transcript_74730:90-680(+)
MAGKGDGKSNATTGGYAGLLGPLKDLAQTASAQVSAAASTVASAAQERLETAQGGKKLLDSGGPEVEARLVAKKTARDAVTLDRTIVAKLATAAQSYEEAAKHLKVATEGPASQAGDAPTFNQLSKDYEARAKALRVALEALKTVPQAPEVSPVEQDAITILMAKGQYRKMASQTAEGLSTLQQKTSATGASGSAA